MTMHFLSPGHAEARTRTPAPLGLDVVGELDEIEDTWRRFEAAAITTPFQRFDWIRAYATTIAAARGRGLRVVVARDAAGRVVFVLPLEIEARVGGTRVATVPGGVHANVQLPLLSAAAAELAPGALRRLLAGAAPALGGVDAFHFRAQPLVWDGRPNPFAAGGVASGERLRRIVLDGDPADVLHRTMGRDSRKKLRQKRRRLEALGTVAHRVAAGPAEAAGMLEVFFEQKAARLRAQGIPNPFVGAAREFLRRAACADDAEHVAVDVHALTLDGHIVAVFGATSDARRACGMFNSFAPEPALRRASVGYLLLAEVIGFYARTGRGHFDLGIGEAEYKETFCDHADPIVESFLPLTAAGVGWAGLAWARLVAKRIIKRRPAFLGTLRRFVPRPAETA